MVPVGHEQFAGWRCANAHARPGVGLRQCRSHGENITSLSASTTYYYQAVAENSLGTTSGTIFSFATTPAPYFKWSPERLERCARATTGNTSTLSVTPWYGFTGAVSLSCAITPTAASDPPTCSVPTTVTISGATAQTATLTVNTTAATAMNQPASLPWRGAGGALLACVALLFVPLRRRSWLAMVAWAALFAATAGMGCGGEAAQLVEAVVAAEAEVEEERTPGRQLEPTLTIKGVSGGMTETGTVALTVQ